ncbi:hypothetical protein [Thermotoga maritima]|uniref:hypothetical protein n=1 Tax=Thermotoga maritima TaxID=2336 RepID=UPI0011871EF1|nr:hypothetical protein [Thermotoga maritima]
MKLVFPDSGGSAIFVYLRHYLPSIAVTTALFILIFSIFFYTVNVEGYLIESWTAMSKFREQKPWASARLTDRNRYIEIICNSTVGVFLWYSFLQRYLLIE